MQNIRQEAEVLKLNRAQSTAAIVFTHTHTHTGQPHGSLTAPHMSICVTTIFAGMHDISANMAAVGIDVSVSVEQKQRWIEFE